jgi:hypothetical protein
MAEDKEPRRYKMPSELDTDDQAAASRFGGGQHCPERAEYVEWRRRTLENERDDLELRERLLREQVEVLRTQAAGTRMDALEAVSPADYDRHLRAVQDAWEAGTERPSEPGGSARADKWDAHADQLESEADEIAQHIAEEAAA